MMPLLLIAGGFYAVAFWVVGLRRPDLALAAVFATAPIQNDLSSGGPLRFSIAEINLLLLLPILLLRWRRFGGGMILLATGGYFLAGLICTVPHWRETSLLSLVQMALYLILGVILFAALPRRSEDYRLGLNGYIVVACVIAAAATILRSGYVLGLHKNNAGSSLAAGLLIALELSFHTRSRKGRWAYLAAALLLAVGLINTLSRGAWLSAMVGTLVLFSLRRQFGLMLKVGLAGTVVVAACWNLLPEESRTYATGLDAELSNLKPRYESKEFALLQFSSSPLVGRGIGLRKEFDATNFVFLTLAETGLVGAGALLVSGGIIAFAMWRAQRDLPRESFGFSLVALACALGLGKLAHGMVDHYWVRGTLLVSWASLGMATRAHYELLLDWRRWRRQRRAEMAPAEETHLLAPQN